MSQSTPTDVEVTRYAEHYIKYGNKTKAFRHVFKGSKAKGKSLNERACKFHAFVKVLSRIEELQGKVNGKAEGKALFTIEQALDELSVSRALALTPDLNGRVQAGASVQATMGKAKIAGILVDKVEHSGQITATVEVAGLQAFAKRVGKVLAGKSKVSD